MRSKADLTAAIHGESRAVLVVNTRSRRSSRVYDHLPSLLRAAGVRLLAEFPVTRPENLVGTLDRALAMRPDLLVFGGGDGSMSTAASSLAHRDVALGALPLGTTNNFVRSLGLPLGVRGAIRTIGAGKVADVDLGLVRTESGEQLFANLASLGLSVEVARGVPHGMKWVLGRAAYALTAARALPSHRPFLAAVTADGEKQTLWTHQLNIANGRFHAGRAIARDASIDDRLLVAYRLGHRQRRGISVAMLGQLVRGARRHLAAKRFLTADEIHLETDPPLPIDVDGEVWRSTPATFSVVPNALRVVVSESAGSGIS